MKTPPNQYLAGAWGGMDRITSWTHAVRSAFSSSAICDVRRYSSLLYLFERRYQERGLLPV